ncbi:MAG: replication-associated recombination protein A [Gemmatimonadota bacterium]
MSDELELFGEGRPGKGGEGGEVRSASEREGDAPDAHAPLAARIRPRGMEEFRGQAHLLGSGKPFRRMLEGGPLSSCILWGPPGSGKTTLARLLADRADAAFVSFSAVTEGVGRVREIIAEAKARLAATGRRTILFCDEIHRFNKSQQDAFLPHVEDGTVILVGATTENPSFEVNRPLLSRAPVFILEPLSEADLLGILGDALADGERGLGASGVSADPEALSLLARGADGDARRALGALEAAVELAGAGGAITPAVAEDALQHRFAVYDKGGEEHYNVISALHKSVRGSDPDAALYWLARMVRGGEDPLYLARRLIRMAVEDIGVADPNALSVAVAAWQAYHFLGSPEGELALAEAAVYLATAPKSNRTYVGWSRAMAAAADTASEPVPLHIRNAPTTEMKAWGYGSDYRYDPEEPDGVALQRYLPDALEGTRFYEPGKFGFEKTIRERLEWWARRRPGAAPPQVETESPGGHDRGDSG